MKFILIALVVFPMLMSCGKDGKNGANGVAGLDGMDGKDGIQGEQGERGEKGDKGDKGEDGEDASVKTVKFCPNLVDNYGTAYSERGICVDGKVFAVYSANGMASLVELSHGKYMTTSPSGGNCTFTVDENTCK